MLLFGALLRKVDFDLIWNFDSDDHVFWATAVMSRTRFKTIYSKLTFDDIETRKERSTDNKMYKINEIFERFRSKIKNCFEPYNELCVDETLYPFRGRCPFKQYIPTKPAKYGLKFWSIVDVKSNYVLDTELYVGKEANQINKSQNIGAKVVLNLSKPFYYSGRVVTCDNFFTSVDLAQKLWLNGLHLVGTLRSNKKEIPNEFKPNKQRELYSSLFGFNDYLTLVSYVPKEKKTVILLSSFHHFHDVDELHDKKKPNMILDYNKNKAGVDNVDKMIASYTCGRKTNKWTLKVFMYMIDVAANNSFSFYKYLIDKMSRSQRRKSIKSLAYSLMTPFIEERVKTFQTKNYKHVESNILLCIKKTGIEISKNEVKTDEATPLEKKKTRPRCEKCPMILKIN